jgi:hypothetical protein
MFQEYNLVSINQYDMVSKKNSMPIWGIDIHVLWYFLIGTFFETLKRTLIPAIAETLGNISVGLQAGIYEFVVQIKTMY